MDKKELKEYFDILEISIDASIPEIRKAYSYLKTLYSGSSIVISPLQDEFNEINRKEILENIERAYQSIIESFEVEKKKECAHKKPLNKSTLEAIDKYISQLDSFTGKALKDIRKFHNLDLREVAECTNISRRYLKSIEEEDYLTLPQKVYLKGFIISYAEHLDLDSHTVATDMMMKYEYWLKTSKTQQSDTNNL